MGDAGFCPSCGAPHVAGDVFCGSCGTRLPDPEPAPAAPMPPYQAPPAVVPAAAPPPYTPPPATPTAYQPPPPGPPPFQQPYPAYPPAQQGYGVPPPGPQAPGSGPAVAGGLKIRVVPLIGAVAIALSSALPWLTSVVSRGLVSPSQNGFDVPFKFLFDPTGASGGLKVGLALVLLGVAGGLLTFVRATGAIRRLLGVAAIAIGGAYIAQLIRFVNDLGGGISVTKVMGFGVYVAIGGGVLLAAGK